MDIEKAYWICSACAKKNGGSPTTELCWYNMSECDCCKKVVAVTKKRNWKFIQEKEECESLCC
jgi:hypothetical protein